VYQQCPFHTCSTSHPACLSTTSTAPSFTCRVAYKDSRLDSVVGVFFYCILLLRNVLSGVLVGIQQGAGMPLGSPGSAACNVLNYLVCLAFAIIVLAWRPFNSLRMNIITGAVTLVEVGVTFTIMILCWRQEDWRAQDAGFYLQCTAFALAVLFSWVTTGALVSGSEAGRVVVVVWYGGMGGGGGAG
jgi:hypothetical protein